MPEEKPPQKPAREPQALSSEYHKARKQLMLWAGILFIWELVGIDLEKAKEAGGNAGAIIGAIKSPQAVPWVLLILVFYFVFKLRIEWGQCNLARRGVRESRIDYLSAFVVAGAAFALYFGQAISRVQFANAVEGSSRFNSFGLGASIAMSIIYPSYFVWEWIVVYRRKRNDLIFGAVVWAAGTLAVSFVFLRQTQILWPYLLLGPALILLTHGPVFYWVGRRRRRQA